MTRRPASPAVDDGTLDRTLQALAEPTRRAVVGLLRAVERAVVDRGGGGAARHRAGCWRTRCMNHHEWPSRS